MPIVLIDEGPVLRAVYRQPLNSLGLINTLIVPPLAGYFLLLNPFRVAPIAFTILLTVFLVSTYYFADRLFGRTIFTYQGSTLTLTHRVFFPRSRDFNVLQMSEPTLTQEEWVRLRIPWAFERPSRMLITCQGTKVRCCRRMTEAELFELLSAIRRRNREVDRNWDSEPVPEPSQTGPLHL